MRAIVQTTCLLLAIFFLSLSSNGQVASPGNFPHASGAFSIYPGNIAPYPDHATMAMGMNGYVATSAKWFAFGMFHYLCDSTFDPVLQWNPLNLFSLETTCTINKDRKVWYSINDGPYNARVSVFSTTGTVHHQFKLPGYGVTDLIADTSGHIYLIYRDGITPGFGLMRFGTSSFTPDYQKWITIAGTLGNAKWGIDQRLYVPVGTGLCVMDANGNVLKTIQNQPDPYTVFQDHGLATVTFLNDTLRIVRRDSSMNLMWARKIRAGHMFNFPIQVRRASLVAMPGSGDLLVVASTEANYPYLCSGPSTSFDTQLTLFDRNGVLQAAQKLAFDTRLLSAETTPFGDPLLFCQEAGCFGPVTTWDLTAYLLPGYNLRQNCGGYAPGQPAFTYSPVGSPTVGTIPAVANAPLALIPDVLNLQLYPYSGYGTYQCEKPCVNFTSQAQGGGLVAFSDDAYGFHSLQYAFGDGTFGTTPDPLHQYPTLGSYTATLIATNGCGADTFSIPVNPCIEPQWIGPTAVCQGSPVWFTEGSGLPDDSLTWLVNGMLAGSSDSLQWTPTAVGVYQIGLVYRDAPCRDTTTVSVTVSTGTPTSAFSYTMVPPLNLQFNNLSTNGVSYLWTFGDGTTSTLANPIHQYATNGTYNICLTTTNGCGSATSCQTWACPFPNANFTATTSGAVATLTNTSTGATSFFWDFGDGSTATGNPGSHTYTSTGTFTICLIANSGCLTDTLCRNVTVVGTADDFYRINYYPSAISGSARQMATSDNGFTCVVGTTNSSGPYLCMVDTLGNMMWYKGFFLPNSYQLWDVVAMPNGHFLIVGASSQAGAGGTDGFWVEMDVAGNFINGQVVGTTANETIMSVKRARDGGYLLVGTVDNNGGFYLKVNAALQLQWCRRLATLTPQAMFQAPDMSHWIVASNTAQPNSLRYIHLDAAGVEFEEFGATLFSTGALTFPKFAMEMDCRGHIYTVTVLRDNVPGVGFQFKMAFQNFNTTTRTGTNFTYRCGGGANGTSPLYDLYLPDLVIRPDGKLLAVGSILNRALYNTQPYSENVLVHINPDNSTATLAAYGTTAADDQFMTASVQGNGLVMAAGYISGGLRLYRFFDGSECQLPVSTLANPNVFNEGGTPPTLGTVTVASAPYGTVVGLGTGFNPQTTTNFILCATPCNIPVTAAFTSTVVGSNVTFTSTSTPGSTLSWSIPGACTTTGIFTSNVSQNGTFTTSIPCGTTVTVSLTASNACNTSTSTQTITMPVGQPVSIGANQTVCPGASATFTATPGFTSYLWSNAATTSAITVTTPGTYTVTATSANGCTSIDTATLSNFTPQTISAGPNQTVCPGASGTFTATSGFTNYLWSNGATTSTITVTTPGTYTVTATDANGCLSSGAATLSHHAAPTVSIGPNQSVCVGASATFTATPGFTGYLWSNGATNNTITVSLPNTYAVTVTDANGCTASASATLGHHPVPTFSLGPDTSFCPDTTWLLTGPSGLASYLWSSAATTPNIVAAAAGTFALTVTDANGCTAADDIVLTVSTDCVWPGDANHDGVADNQDVLAVGYGFGFSGPVRPGASPSWYGQPAPTWPTSLPSLVNHKHPDCDGNGTIDYLDTVPIATNYGLTHNKNAGVTTGLPLWIVPELDSFPAGDTVFFTVHWGDPGQMVANGHGLAFRLHIDAPQITAGTLSITYPASFFGNGLADLLTFTHPTGLPGDWDMAISRMDRQGRSGAGAVMRVGFLPDALYPLTSTLGYIPVRLTNPFAVDGDFMPLLMGTLDDSILVYSPVNGTNPANATHDWRLYPVPTSDLAILEWTLKSEAKVAATLVDMQGRQISNLLEPTTLPAGTGKTLIETTHLSQGMYFVQISIDGTTKAKKLVVKR